MASGDTLAIFGPAANQPPAAGYAPVFVRNGHLVLAFAQGAGQAAIVAGIMPRTYGGGGLTVIVSWMAIPVAGTVGWGASFERMNAANHDLDADAWAAEQVIAAVAVDATSGKVTVTSVAIAAGALTDAIAAGDPFRLRIRRAVGDTAAGDAHLLAIEVRET